MKKQFIRKALSIFGLMVAGISYAQSNTENYVQSKNCLNNDCSKISETITYFDGLGRAKQIINVKTSPTGKDLVTPVTYDGFGRQTKNILPTPVATQNSLIHSGITNESTANSYYGVANAFAETEIENSPLDRVLQQANAGDAWKLSSGHTQKFKYEANTEGEVRKFVTNTSTNTVNNISNTVSSLSIPSDNSGYYPANVLYKNTVTDEDGNPVVQFENGQGQVVLIRRTDGSQNIDTYYVYNEYNQKAFIITPKAEKQIEQNNKVITESILNDLCYQYRYDGLDREVEKKLPGKDWEFMVYDKQDRPVLAQDGMLRTVNNNFGSKGWMFTKYDQFNRVVCTGFFSNTATRQVMQNALNSMADNASNNEKRSSAFFTLQGMEVYYDKRAFPTGSMTLLTVNYYDTYPQGAPAVPSTILGQHTLPQTLGTNDDASTNNLQTASYVKNIEDNNWTKTYTYFDSKGRTLATKTTNHLGGLTNKEFKLDFTGQAEESYTSHKRTPNETEVKIKERFVYDNQKRLVKQYHQVDNLQEELLVENTYNDIGQLINKKTGNTTGTPLQSIDNTYNIRGWLTSVNNPNNAASFNGKLFGFELKYENPANATFASVKYNGNISEFDWKTANGNMLRRYAYNYDKLERLKDASYHEPSTTVPVTNGYGEFLTYDVNGNIQTLKRYQAYDNTPLLIDDLNYEIYKGNQLIKVTDLSTNSLGYSAGGNTIAYDLNGNMINHLDKGITDISYNYLNLPKEVKFTQNNNNLKFIYRADGIKLQKAYTYYSSKSGLMLTENTEYLDGFQYEDKGGASSLQFFPTSEGYYDFQKKRYVYNYEDHVGNIRLAYYKGDNNVATIDKETNYYPFGLEHQGYNGTYTQTPNYTYGFQGQEKQKETGWSSFKWRNSIPELGRFFNVDPLSEKYAYQSHYNFSENRVVDGRELEGLEWIGVITRFTPLMENTGVRPILEPLAETSIKAGETSQKSTQEHHIIPRQFKNSEVVKEAREQGFEFEGKENKISLEKFSKATGEGRHANHPRYNQQIKELLKEISKTDALESVRNLRDKAKDAINTNPDKKVNDLKLKNTPPIKIDNIKVDRNPLPQIGPKPQNIPKSPKKENNENNEKVMS
jgi:RHS repeat-associated protein